MIGKFPYGKAPFWLLVIAVVSTVLRVVTHGHRPARPDLILVTFSNHHYEAYKQAIPRFEREHGVKVQVQNTNYAALQSRLQSAILAGTEAPDLVEVFAGSLGFFTRGPTKDIGLVDLTDRLNNEGLTDRLVASRFSMWSERGRIYAIPHDVHPVMLGYRRDIVEQLGIDVRELDTWDKFVAVGQRVTRDTDGDGVVDRYMIDLPDVGSVGPDHPAASKRRAAFRPRGACRVQQRSRRRRLSVVRSPDPRSEKIAWDCGVGQSQMKAIADGLAIFHVVPDWRSHILQTDLPGLAGKMALMPMPAWKKGGRRTSVWGGTGLIMMKQTKHPDLAWELAKYLYFDAHDSGKRFAATNIIPVLKDAWNLPEFKQPNPYYSNQPIGRMYADLAPETPPVYSSAVEDLAEIKLEEAYSRVVQHYKSHGEDGLVDRIHLELGARRGTMCDGSPTETWFWRRTNDGP